MILWTVQSKEAGTVFVTVDPKRAGRAMLRLARETREPWHVRSVVKTEVSRDHWRYLLSRRELGRFGKRGLKIEAKNPPIWAVNKAIWKRAKIAVFESPKGMRTLSRERGTKYKDVYAAVTSVYKRMGGRIA